MWYQHSMNLVRAKTRRSVRQDRIWRMPNSGHEMLAEVLAGAKEARHSVWSVATSRRRYFCLVEPKVTEVSPPTPAGHLGMDTDILPQQVA